MSSTDRLKMLAGLPIEMSDSSCLIYPATLMDIAHVGVEKYFKYVNLLTISDVEIKRIIGETELSVFDFIIINCVKSNEFKEEFLNALSFFTKDEILLIPEIKSFILGKLEDQRFLTEDNFLEFQDIILAQNFVNKENKSKGEDPIAKKINEKLAKGREKIARIKGKKEGEPELVDLIGSLSAKTALSIDRIWGVSFYAFNDQFKRMRLFEQYETNLQSLMAGADPKKVKLEDWIKNIQ